jgi:hypothetical protein
MDDSVIDGKDTMKTWSKMLITMCLFTTQVVLPADGGSSGSAALPEPERKEMRLSDLRQHLAEFDGKIVATTINAVLNAEQLTAGWTRFSCGYYSGGKLSTIGVVVPKEGLSFFLDLQRVSRSGPSGDRTVYMRVYSREKPLEVGSNRLFFEAVGVRYNSMRSEYSW